MNFNINKINSEKVLKVWSKIFMYGAGILIILAFLAAVIVLAIDIDFWWISLIVIAGAPFLALPAILASHLLLGFSDIISNTKKTSCVNSEIVSYNKDVLPEL